MATLGVAMSLYHVYARLTTAPPDSLILRIMTLMFSLVLGFLLFPRATGSPRDRIPWTDLALAALSLWPLFYLIFNYRYVVDRLPAADPLSLGDKVAAGLAILLVLEAARRTLGPALPLVVVGFMLYAVAGPWLPVLPHRGLTLEVLLDQTFFTTEGLFGIPLGVAGSYVILFIIFGAFLEKSGAGQFFMNFANALAGGARGGPGKVAVISSSCFGTISGSAVANVMVDGWLTIPMMKRTGFKPEAAAAIEAVASTGGQIMPPIMGAAAFVMAEFLGVSYTAVMVAALIPALLYYASLFAAIHFNAVRSGLRGIPREELPALGLTLRQQGHLFVPVVIIFALLVAGFSATYAAIVSTVSVILLSYLRTESRIGLTRAIEALRAGATQTVPVAMATAAAGIVIGVIMQLGVAIRFSAFLVDIASSSLLVALVITMVAGLILGMGMPTTASYLMQVAILIPALITLGVRPMAAHMFAFYFSCLSSVTPPVALAVYAAASISRSSLWGSGWQAVKFAAAGFIVPFFFVYSPALLFDGPWVDVVRAMVSGTIGVIALAAGLEGYFIRPTIRLERLIFIAAALTLIHPGLATDLIGVGLLGLGLGMQKLRRPDPVGVPVVSPR